ncbi:MAG: hypothetical protein ABSG48_00415 [Geobacteraceae bacterium]|jgi:hypothetical protein
MAQEENEGKRKKLTPEEWEQKKQDRLNRKLQMAQRDDMDFVSRKAEDTSDFIILIGTTDFLVDKLRKSMGRKRRIDGIKAVQFIARIEAIKDELNLWNAEVSRELKRDYKPPYGYDNPLKKEKKEAEG